MGSDVPFVTETIPPETIAAAVAAETTSVVTVAETTAEQIVAETLFFSCLFYLVKSFSKSAIAVKPVEKSLKIDPQEQRP